MRGQLGVQPFLVDGDDDLAPIRGVTLPAGEAELLEPVDDPGDGAGGEAAPPGELGGGHRPVELQKMQEL